MTYTIVTALLVLALIAVVIAVVFMTEDDEPRESFEITVQPPFVIPDAGAGRTTLPTAFIESEEMQSREIRVVDVPEKTDRDSGPVGV